MALTITEGWIRDRVNLKHDNLDDVKSLSLPGSYHEKIVHFGNSLRSFTRLKHLDLSRNDISILDGLDHLKLLETLNLYYNNVTSLKELYKLRYNSNLKEIDLRLNPVTKNEPDYRLFVIHMNPNIKVLDDRSVRDSERKAAIEHFVSDQASKFDSTPKRNITQDKDATSKTSSHARVEMISKLGSRPSALADDDIALIDLISKTDFSASSNKLNTYKAESYNSKELRDIPEPHSEKYSHFRGSSPETSRPMKAEKSHVEFQDEMKNVNSKGPDYDDYHPFVTNGNFTANPTAHARKSNQSHDRGTGKPKEDYGRFLTNNEKRSAKRQDRKRFDELNSSPPRRGVEAYDEVTAKENDNVESGRLVTRYQGRASESEMKESKPEKQAAFVNSSDFNEEEIATKMPKEKTSTSLKQEEIFLLKILELVDKYWNGSNSLQKNAKFQALAYNATRELLSGYSPTGFTMHEVASLKNDLETRVREIDQLHALLREHEIEREKLKKRLQNEDEIQRTIELTDQDLRRLQEKIEEVQAENKAFKADKQSIESEREQFKQLLAENEELRQCKISQEREITTLVQQCEQHSTTLSQLQELTSMLQESHRSLVVTNDHLLQELDETRQRHQHEVQQLHWSYEQLKKTANWLPRSSR